MSYRFSTAAQFDACLFDLASRASGTAGLRPLAPFAHVPSRFETRGGHAPAVTPAGEILWRDEAGALHRLTACAELPESVAAPASLARAARIIATKRGLWVAGGPASLELYEDESLARLLRVELPGESILDIAGDVRGGLVVLVERGGVIHIDCAGRIVERIALDGIARAKAFVFLRRSASFVVLAGERARQRLYWCSAQDGAVQSSMAVAGLGSCFTADAIGSDGRGSVFVAGADDASFGGAARVLGFDAGGNAVSSVPLDALDAPATGVVVARDSLIVTGPRGLLRFGAAEVVPDGAGQVHTTLLTPMLQSPDREDGRRWLRVEAAASLPEGSSIEIMLAATDDAEVRDRMAAIFADATLPPSQRIRALRAEPEIWRAPIVFHGQAANAATPFAAPLFDVREQYLWVSIALTAAAGARLPELSSFAVLYPGRTLMENLPSIYQRDEARPGSFLRGMVGVLETTTQELDGRIASMGGRIHPSTAPDEWLDYLARWLGLPWDDALSREQKKALVGRAPELARGRGTRAGLEALLDSLIPGTPRRFRVTDATADFGFATVGGDGFAGSALPAVLGGLTRTSPKLDAGAILGSLRLVCPGQREDDGAWQLAGTIGIEVAASSQERKAWEPWLLALIQEMVPLTARVALRWVGPHALRGDRLDGSLQLEAAPVPDLGAGAVTGLVRLPAGGARLSASGADIGTRLR